MTTKPHLKKALCANLLKEALVLQLLMPNINTSVICTCCNGSSNVRKTLKNLWRVFKIQPKRNGNNSISNNGNMRSCRFNKTSTNRSYSISSSRSSNGSNSNISNSNRNNSFNKSSSSNINSNSSNCLKLNRNPLKKKLRIIKVSKK